VDPFVVGAGDADGRERGCLGERNLAGLAELEQREEGDGLLDPRKSARLRVEVEDAACAQDGSEALEEL
jgi:hypothetical protein